MESPDELHQRAVDLHLAGRLDEAEALYRSYMALKPTLRVHLNLAVLLKAQDRFEEADLLMRKAVEARPEDLEVQYAAGNLWREMQLWPQSEAAYRAVLRMDPTNKVARLNLGLQLLGLERYEEGWPLYEERSHVPGQGMTRPQLPYPEWRGESLAGRSILVWHEQGLGDMIQFVRFAPALKALGATKVTLSCPPELAALFAPMADQILVREPTMTVPKHDVWTFYGSVAGHLGITPQTIPAAPYLSAPPDRREKWRDFLRPGFNVGVIWHGNPAQPRDRYRSLPNPDLLKPLQATGANIVDLQEPLGDLADLAAVMERLDLVVSVDTGPAHLAGALGRPCWIIYPYRGTDWRWHWGTDRSPWYPSVRLYRQATPGDWPGVVARVAHDLAAKVKAAKG